MNTDAEDTSNLISTIPVEQFQSSWEHLGKRDKYVLEQRHSGKTLESVGRELDLTRERVRQLQVAANKKFISRLKHSWDGWDDWSEKINDTFTIVNLHDLSVEFCDGNAAVDFLSMVFKYLGWKPQKIRQEWWVQDLDVAAKAVSGLVFNEPVRRSEWTIYLSESGLPDRYVQYLIDEGLLPLETFQDYIIRSKYRRRDKAHVYLLEHAPAHINKIADALGEKSTRPLDAFMERQDVFTKVFPGGKWSLTEFADVKYKRAIDAVIDILSDHGPLTQRELDKYMSDEYPVSPARIQQCLTDFRIGKMPDGKIWLVEHGAAKKDEPEPEQPTHMHCSGHIIGIRRQIDGDTVRGSGLMDNRWLAWKLGLHSTPMKKIFVGANGLPEMSVTRAGSNCQLSAIREAVSGRGLALGCSVVIILDMGNTTWDLKHTCSDPNCNGTTRKNIDNT